MPEAARKHNHIIFSAQSPIFPIFRIFHIKVADSREDWSTTTLQNSATITPENTRPAGRFVIPHQPKRSQHLVAWAVFLVERLVAASLRCQWEDNSGLAEAA